MKMKNSEKKQILLEIKEKTSNCLNSRKHANDLIEVISKLQDDEESVVLASIRSVHKLFSHYLEVGEMLMEQDSSEDLSNEDKYKQWLRDRYKDAAQSLVEMLLHSNTSVQELALSVLMKLIVKESNFPVSSKDCTDPFPHNLFKNMWALLLSDEVNNTGLLQRFEEYYVYDDIRYHTMKLILSLCDHKSKQKITETWLGNVFAVLEKLTIPSVQKDEPLKKYLCAKSGQSQKIASVVEQRRLYSCSWVEFLKFKLTPTLYRKVLVIIHEKVMPNIASPLVLSDFLIESYNIGGAISLLALSGLFELIQKHNLHYPDFYEKLYAMFEPNIFHVKYKARFFYLADLFLSSTHLPSYLVAAFAKRLARISLVAPPAGLLVSVPFIFNLIIRHPNCKSLIHKPDMEMDFDDDPYDHSEQDPAKCKAMESCLWELQTLQHHYHPDVIKLAKKIYEGDIPDSVLDLSDKFELSANDVFEKECTKKLKTTATTFEAPKGLLGCKDDKLSLCWTL
ncbi:nucleolar complex protein 4 homolog B-like [Ruditapes philippinarum]|uniref:nucleolar complex protein 4 homolog B-like n=1 Tax=Ruditapes philippinarum TaxID=129788 RepID=UPI00295BCAE7|nr:nucleolar complex protein 4 homolog B-like [Ruditapes philippinarum]